MSEAPVYLVGAGGHGRVVLDALLSQSVRVAGIVDPGLPVGSGIHGVAVLGGDGELDRLAAGSLLVNGLGANPRVGPRRDLFLALTARGFEFIVLRHAASVIGWGCRLGAGTQIMAGAVIQTGVGIGDNVVVNTRAGIDHDSSLGAHSFVGPGVTVCGDVRVAEGVFVGAGAVILPGVEIGAGAIVAAGAVVTRDVEQGLLVAGNPARVMRTKGS